jgi:hypothetical protein
MADEDEVAATREVRLGGTVWIMRSLRRWKVEAAENAA